MKIGHSEGQIGVFEPRIPWPVDAQNLQVAHVCGLPLFSVCNPHSFVMVIVPLGTIFL